MQLSSSISSAKLKNLAFWADSKPLNFTHTIEFKCLQVQFWTPGTKQLLPHKAEAEEGKTKAEQARLNIQSWLGGRAFTNCSSCENTFHFKIWACFNIEMGFIQQGSFLARWIFIFHAPFTSNSLRAMQQHILWSPSIYWFLSRKYQREVCGKLNICTYWEKQ